MTTKVVKTFSVSLDVNNWLADKAARENINVSAFVNKLLEEKMIIEMEEKLNENTERISTE